MAKHLYLSAAIVGAVVPYLFFLGVFHDQLVPISGFLGAVFANTWAGGFGADLIIASGVFWTFMFRAARHEEAPAPWLYIVLNLTIGLSCALPAYLYAVERRREDGLAMSNA